MKGKYVAADINAGSKLKIPNEQKCGKKGSYIVFLTIFLSAMMLFVWAVLAASGQLAIASAAKDFGRTWGRSILGEYDRYLKDRYGFFGFYADTFTAEKKLDFYAGSTFREKKYITYGDIHVSLDTFSLTKPEVFSAQLREIVASGVKPRQNTKYREECGRENNESTATQSESTTYDAVDETETGSSNRVIRNQRILSTLPSKGKVQKVDVSALIKALKDGFNPKNLATGGAISLYTERFFRDHVDDKEQGETFFRNEMEYLLTGKTDDARSLKSTATTLKLLRNGLNLAYLYGCSEKREAALAAAQLITPGPAATALQAVILETWAWLEAENDWKLLQDGKSVPVLKKDENWAITLDNVLESEFADEPASSENLEAGEKADSDGQSGEKRKEENMDGSGTRYIKPQKIEGISYRMYLHVLLSGVSQETKMLRMMDLIQINLKYLYLDNFLLKDYYTGLKYEMNVNNKKYEFEEAY